MKSLMILRLMPFQDKVIHQVKAQQAIHLYAFNVIPVFQMVRLLMPFRKLIIRDAEPGLRKILKIPDAWVAILRHMIYLMLIRLWLGHQTIIIDAQAAINHTR